MAENGPLYKAVIRNDVDLLEHVLIQPGCDINATTTSGLTCLHVAVLNKSIDVLHTLLKSGAEVNVQNYEQQTPLHYAVISDNLEAACMLLYYGIDVSILCTNHESAFTLALKRNRTNIAQVLFPYYDVFSDADLDGCNALHIAAEHKSELAFDLVNAGIDVNSLTFCGTSALLLSFHYNNADLFKLIWSKLNHETLFYYEEPFVIFFIETWPFSSQEWVECMYLILESPLAFELIHHWRDYNACEVFGVRLFSKLLKTFCRFDVCKHEPIAANDRVTIMYIFLSLGCSITSSDINYVSMFYGFNKELEIFLYLGDFNLNNSICLSPLPAFIFSLKDPDPNFIIYFFKNQIETYNNKLEIIYYPLRVTDVMKDILRALSFFSLPFNSKRKILKYWCSCFKEHKMISNKLKNLPKFPSLLELCRNEVRHYLKSSYSLKKPYQFYDLVKNLELPTNLKDIINFKTPLYL